MAASFFRDMQRIVSNREQELTQRRNVLFQSAVQLAGARMETEAALAKKNALMVEANVDSIGLTKQFDRHFLNRTGGNSPGDVYEDHVDALNQVMSDPINIGVDPETMDDWYKRLFNQAKLRQKVDAAEDKERGRRADKDAATLSQAISDNDDAVDNRDKALAIGAPSLVRHLDEGRHSGGTAESLAVMKVRGFGLPDTDIGEAGGFPLGISPDDEVAQALHLYQLAGMAYSTYRSGSLDPNNKAKMDKLADFGVYEGDSNASNRVLEDIGKYMTENPDVDRLFIDYSQGYMYNPGDRHNFRLHHTKDLKTILQSPELHNIWNATYAIHLPGGMTAPPSRDDGTHFQAGGPVPQWYIDAALDLPPHDRLSDAEKKMKRTDQAFLGELSRRYQAANQ